MVMKNVATALQATTINATAVLTEMLQPSMKMLQPLRRRATTDEGRHATTIQDRCYNR